MPTQRQKINSLNIDVIGSRGIRYVKQIRISGIVISEVS